ncbi:hypothetical protein [Bdellovibrio sp. HCB337]|uniref:hypothetical protein n=1 Tax=Bdellovibrio sp. HCB337 TaxID=3394358 RepID=UPI0039A42673
MKSLVLLCSVFLSSIAFAKEITREDATECFQAAGFNQRVYFVNEKDGLLVFQQSDGNVATFGRATGAVVKRTKISNDIHVKCEDVKHETIESYFNDSLVPALRNFRLSNKVYASKSNTKTALIKKCAQLVKSFGGNADAIFADDKSEAAKPAGSEKGTN